MSGRAALLALALLACGGGPPTFTRVQSEVFTSCTFAACHTGSRGAEGLNLDKPAYARIVNVAEQGFDGGTLMLVVPNKPDESYLYEKITKDVPRAGARMPNTGDPLDAARIQLVKDWITAGALND